MQILSKAARPETLFTLSRIHVKKQTVKPQVGTKYLSLSGKRKNVESAVS